MLPDYLIKSIILYRDEFNCQCLFRKLIVQNRYINNRFLNLTAKRQGVKQTLERVYAEIYKHILIYTHRQLMLWRDQAFTSVPSKNISDKNTLLRLLLSFFAYYNEIDLSKTKRHNSKIANLPCTQFYLGTELGLRNRLLFHTKVISYRHYEHTGVIYWENIRINLEISTKRHTDQPVGKHLKYRA